MEVAVALVQVGQLSRLRKTSSPTRIHLQTNNITYKNEGVLLYN